MVAPLITRAVQYGDRLRSSVQLASDQTGQTFEATPDRYLLNEAYYSGNAYLARRAGLPKNIRSILPLTKAAVDWWTGHVYPGVWTPDGLPGSGGRPNRLPYASDTPKELRESVQQAFTWSKFSGGDLGTYVLQGALYGDVFAEVNVDYERGKVYPRLLHASHVTDLEFNNSGDLIAYQLSIPMKDANGVQYRWGKRVTKTTITTYYDDEPRGYDGQPAEMENPWGFAPAVWVMHRDVGGQHGAWVMDGLLPTVDELNGMQASVNDYTGKMWRQKVGVSSKDPTGLFKMLKALSSTAPSDPELQSLWRLRRGETHDDDIDVIPAPEGVSVFHLLQNMGLAESAIHFDRMMTALERNLPEVMLSERLQSAGDVRQVGVRMLIQDVQHKLDNASANYDSGVVKLGQMCCSIGGELARSGQWGPRSQLTDQQKKFLPFSLQSWDRGELDFSLEPRDLLPLTMLDRATESLAIERLTTPFGLRHAGLSPADIYGVGPTGEALAPAQEPGILADRQNAQSNAAGAFGNLFNAGNVG